MRRAALFLLLLACGHSSGNGPRPASPLATAPVEGFEAEASEAVEVKRRLSEPADASPEFIDPKRRDTLASAFPAIAAYVETAVKRDNLVGLAAGVVIDGELVWTATHGLRDPARGLPVTANTLFGIGSITKTITTLAILKLRDEGRLDLDAPAAKYLPELDLIAYPTGDSPPITVRHLLTHTSGLPRMGNFAEYPDGPLTRAEFLASLEGLSLERVPGTRRVYSNLGFQLLGPLIDNVAGVDHRTYIREQILLPIGMQDASWTPEDAPVDQLAVGHELDENRKPRARPHWRPGAADAAGGLYASLEDLARYAAFNLAAWPPRSEAEPGPLRRSTIREAHTLSTLDNFSTFPGGAGKPPQVEVYGTGLGFGVETTCRYEHLVQHAGKTSNYRASLHMLPQQGVAVVLLTNLSSIHSSVLPRDGRAILDLLDGTGGLQPREHTASPVVLDAAAKVAALLEHWDDAAYARVFSADYRDSNPAAMTKSVFGEWRDVVGDCREPRAISASEPRVATIALICERGELHISLRAAPWASADVTSMQILGAVGLEPDPAVVEAAKLVVKMLKRWDERTHRRVFSDTYSTERGRDFLTQTGEALGTCHLGEVRHTARRRGATFVLECEHGNATLQLGLEPGEDAGVETFFIRGDDESGPCG